MGCAEGLIFTDGLELKESCVIQSRCVKKAHIVCLYLLSACTLQSCYYVIGLCR